MCIRTNRGFINQIFIVTVTFLTHLLVGVCRSYPAFFVPQLKQLESPLHLTEDEESWIASINMLLCPVGCTLGGIIMDKLGRKIAVQFIFIPFAISWIVTGLAKNVLTLYIAQILQGVSAGMAFVCSTYIAEVTTAKHRGAMLSTIEVFYALGVLFCTAMMNYLKWQLTAFILFAFSCVSFLIACFLPESPFWLLSKGYREKSIEVLACIRGKDRMYLVHEIADMEKSCGILNRKLDLCETSTKILQAWKPFAILLLLFVAAQGSGYMIIITYLIRFIESLNLPYDKGNISLIYSTVGLVGGMMTPFVMSTYGRKTILAFCGLVTGISVCIIAVYEDLYGNSAYKPNCWIVPTALCAYGVACALGILPIPFILGGELFPLEVRGVMNGIYGSFGYIWGALVIKMYPSLVSILGFRSMLWVFTVSCATLFLHGVFILPETKGRTLTEVQEEYFNKKSPSYNID